MQAINDNDFIMEVHQELLEHDLFVTGCDCLIMIMLKNVLSDEEIRSIPEHVASKIEKVLNENSVQYMNIKALYETSKRDHEKEILEYKNRLQEETEKCETLNVHFNHKCSELDELEKKLNALEKQNSQLKNDVIWQGNEARTYRLQRDEAIDEKSTLQAMLNRRTNELEQLKLDYDNLNEKLNAAVQAKIESLSMLDEIQTKKIELDYKEKRLDKEKQMLTEQINLLTNDASQHSKELVILKREHTSQLIDMQNRLQHKQEEIRTLLENEENYRKQIKNQNDKIEELNARLSGQSEVENQLQQKYIQEIDSRIKLADMYKEMSEESNRKAEELAKTSQELQKLLSEASVQYEDLERQFTINETTYREHMQQKNDTIAALKRELFDANNLIDTLKQNHLSETLDNLSPHAAAAYNMMQKGLTLTQIYSEYATVSEQLLIKTHENEQLQNTFKAFIEELEGKAHILQKRNEEHTQAMETIDRITRSFDQLEMEYNVTKEKCVEAECDVARLSRERDRMQKTISDLSRQVCFLLKELEEAHGGEIIMKQVPDSDMTGFLNSSDVISKKLVTFKDITELQQNNQKLLSVVRDLSEEFEQAEAKLKECNKENMEDKIRQLEKLITERDEAAARQDKVIQMLKSHLKIFQVMGPEVGGSKVMRIEGIDGVLDVKDMKQIEVQTDSAEIDSVACVELKKELAAARKDLTELKNEFETSTKEHVKNERLILDSLEKSEQSYHKLSQDYKKIVSRAEVSEEKCKAITMAMESKKAEIMALENRCRQYSQTIGKHEQTITSLREEAMAAMSALSRNEVLLENSKRECARLKESEARLTAERDVMRQDKQSHSYLLSNLESIKASLDRSESEWKLKMDEKLDSALKECSALRRRLQDEQDRHAEKLNFLEQTLERNRNRIEEEKKSNTELVNMMNSLKTDLDEKNRTIEELKEKLKNTSSKTIAELELSMKNLQNKYEAALRDIEHQQGLTNMAKKDSDDFRDLAESMEKKLVSEREIHLKYQRETEAKITEMAGEITSLRTHNENLQKRINELTGLNETSMVNLNDELQQERRKFASTVEELSILKEQLALAQTEMKAAVEAKLTAEKKYTDEMLQHTNDIKALQNKVDIILDLENRLVSVTAERDDAIRKAESINANWREEENRIRQEVDIQNEKMKAIVQQNELLLNEIENLSLKMAVTQRRDSTDSEIASAALEATGDSNVDNLLHVINYLRKEKNLANSQLEVFSSENRRLKSEVELLKCQLEETRIQLKAEQDKADISSTTAARHAELINKVQTLHALTDSNRVLREERDQYATELAELKEKLSQIETQSIVPLREENKRLQLQIEANSVEITGLNRECTMWRNRVTEMTEKMNKTNSDELKDLKKTLNKEREEYNKTLEALRSVKQEKTKLEEQVKKLQMPSPKFAVLEKERNDLLKERSDLQKELNEAKAKLEKVGHEFGELQKTFAEQESVTNKMKSSNVQIKSIARKYKTQCQELTEQLNSLKTQQVETSVPSTEVTTPVEAEISVGEQNRLRQEGRQQMEAEMNDRVKQLNDQLTASQTKIDKLVSDNKALQETVAEKEVRAADILQQARSRIQSLAKAGKKHQKEAESYKERIQTIENAMREECIARENVIKSSYENRITKMEKEKTELQAERDRLLREVEIVSQRVNTLQRQLHTQQGVKPSVNSSQEKSTTEPPTANIKPMAGPSSSVTKSQQNQQSVAVTPWRSASETPLASIRPMSMQTRTAAVLPTSQTSCSTSQSTVMVPPQQQLVDTSSNAPSIVEAFSSSPSSSSHTDYNMPSTSSSVNHQPLRQVVVTPTQQTSHSAESTQDIEAECGNQELPSQDTLSNTQQSSQVSQNQQPTSLLTSLSQIMAAPTVSQSQLPTVALVLPRIDLQNISAPGSSHLSNGPEQSMVASSQTTIPSLVSASNQMDSSSSASKRSSETYYQQDGEDSNLSQVSASNQHGQQQAVVASSIETAPEQSIVIASSQQSYDKNASESSVASSNANSSNTVTTTQAGLKRSRETEGESSKSGSNTETSSVQPQAKRTRRMEQLLEDVFRNDVDEGSNADMLLRYNGLDVEYQVPTSSQRDQEFDNLVIDSEAEDELEEDEQAMPDDGIIDENDDGQEYVEDEEEAESEEVYQIEESYDGEEQDTTMTSYNEGPDIDEEGIQVQDQDNEAEIMDEESNEVPNQSGRSDSTHDSTPLITGRRNVEQQSSEATSSENSLRAQSASITSNQSPVSLQFSRRPSTISPLSRQQNQQLLLNQYEENTGDDSIVPSTPTLCVPRRTDGFGEAVSSPHVPLGGRFTFSDSNPPTSRAGVAQMISEGIDDTRIDLSHLEENNGTGRSVPSTPLQSSPQDIERIEVGQSGEDEQRMNDELSSNVNQEQQQVSEDILNETDTFRPESADNDVETGNESENLMNESNDAGRDENVDVSSDYSQSEQSGANVSQASTDEPEEGREAEAAATKTTDVRPSPQPIPTTNQTARRGSGGRMNRQRSSRSLMWNNNQGRNRNASDQSTQDNENLGNRRGTFRDRGRKQKNWYYGKRY